MELGGGGGLGIRPIESMASLDGDVTSSAGTSAALLRREKREEAERDPLWGFPEIWGHFGGISAPSPPSVLLLRSHGAASGFLHRFPPALGSPLWGFSLQSHGPIVLLRDARSSPKSAPGAQHRPETIRLLGNGLIRSLV